MRNYIYVCKFKSRINSVVIIKIIIRKGTAFEELADARIWLKYFRYGVKHYPINQSTKSVKEIVSLDWLTVYHAGYKFIFRCLWFRHTGYQQMKNLH